MRYQYVFVAEIQGLVPPKEGQIIVDVPAIGGTVTYTVDQNAIPEFVDLKSAIGGQMLGGLAGKVAQNRDVELRRAVQLIREKRRRPNASETLAIVLVTGDTEDFELKHTREEVGYVVCLGESPAKAIQKLHKTYVQSLLAGLHLASPHDTSTRTLVDGVVFFRDDGKPVFCYEMEAYGTAYAAVSITQDLADEAARFAAQLSKGRSYADVIRLLSRSMDLSNDQLLSFLSAWAALEIFVSKTFKEYEGLMFSDSGSGPIAAHPEVLQRMRQVMSDKFRLTDKFAIIAGVLDRDDVDTDLKTFATLKGTRDKLLHGKEIQIRNLPCETTRNLASKYLRLHLMHGGTPGAGSDGPGAHVVTSLVCAGRSSS